MTKKVFELLLTASVWLQPGMARANCSFDGRIDTRGLPTNIPDMDGKAWEGAKSAVQGVRRSLNPDVARGVQKRSFLISKFGSIRLPS
ncbi:MAG: hypothetical protein C5B49_01450 [Bdellovibrio sp.]|nr:MAG: hypothetical protein C5B49_01450 [Bdellovibrio sp.]